MPVKTAVIIPCYNEEKAIASVVRKAKQVLPDAAIYVYDNNSSDKTAQAAAEAGAVVRFVGQQGKGSVVRRMFADIDADVYVMTDGDMTYDLDALPELINTLIKRQKDMVVGTRKEQHQAAYRFGHRFGNAMLTFLVRYLFGIRQTDMLSGLRVFSKRFVKTFPACSKGFEIETELNVFTAMNKLPYAEVETNYFARPEGSFSKLSTIKDGFRILFMILRLFRTERPLFFYSLLSLLCLTGSYASVVVQENMEMETGAYPFPFYFFFDIFFLFFLFYGFVSNGQVKTRRENIRLKYLSYPFVHDDDKY